MAHVENTPLSLRLIEKEILPRPVSRGNYNLLASMKDYIMYVENSKINNEIKQETLKLTKVQIKKTELEIQMLGSDLIDEKTQTRKDALEALRNSCYASLNPDN